MAKSPRLSLLLERTSIDYVVAALAMAACLAAAQKWPKVDVLGQLSSVERLTLYGYLIGPTALLLTIAGGALAAYTSASGPRMAILRAFAGERIRRQFAGAVTAPGLAVVSLIAAYVAEAGYNARSARWLVLVASAFVVVRTTRVLYFYTGMLRMVDEDKEEPQPLPSLDDQPLRPSRPR